MHAKSIYIPVHDFYTTTENIQALFKALSPVQLQNIKDCNIERLVIFDDVNGMSAVYGYIYLNKDFSIKEIEINYKFKNRTKSDYRITYLLKDMPEDVCLYELEKFLEKNNLNVNFEFGFLENELKQDIKAVNYDIRRTYQLNSDSSEIPRNLLIKSLDYHYCIIKNEVIIKALEYVLSNDLKTFVGLASWFHFEYNCRSDVKREINTVSGWRKSGINKFYLRARRIKKSALKSLYKKILEIQENV